MQWDREEVMAARLQTVNPDTPPSQYTEDHCLHMSERLIHSIKRADIDAVRQILDSVPLENLNQLYRNKIPPLIWAVKQSRKEILKLLIDRCMNVNQCGYAFMNAFIITLTPLLQALQARDKEVVALLLEAGADPYMHVSKPRPRGQRYGASGWIYPITEAIRTNDTDIVRMMMKWYDPRTPICIDYRGRCFMEEKHTCLCFALTMGHWRKRNSNLFDIVRCIILYGGKLCDSGNCLKFASFVHCVFVKSHGDDGCVKIYCDITNFRILKLIYKTQNIKQGFVTMKSLEAAALHSNREHGSLACIFANEKSGQNFQYVWRFLSNPASLKQSCRVVIRHSTRGLVSKACKRLPLPVALQDYVAVIEEN